MKLFPGLGLLLLTSFADLHAQPVELGGQPLVGVSTTLKSGEFIWAPEAATDGPLVLIVNLGTQRALLFRNGVPIAATTVSTGRAGYETPTGVFRILEKRREHYSSTYDNAPMPNMQRLTWNGVALHAGNLPGYPASHGCIRLPAEFSRLLFGITTLGMTVIITNVPAAPQYSQPPALGPVEVGTAGQSLASAPFDWNPDRSPKGPISVIVSVADKRAIVLRNGVEIGSAPVRVSGGDIGAAWAYALRAWDKDGQHWMRFRLSGSATASDSTANEKQNFDTPGAFRDAVARILRPGSVVIVTPESLPKGKAGQALTVIEDDGGGVR